MLQSFLLSCQVAPSVEHARILQSTPTLHWGEFAQTANDNQIVNR
jgi:hypothetical protein